MILRRLELKSFGCFADCAFDFRRGLNLVCGPSESGKTLLAEAIPCVLFGCRDRQRYRPWQGGAACAAALVFEEAGRALRIERDFLSDQVRWLETDAEGRTLHQFSGLATAAGTTADAEAYRGWLQRYFGTDDETRFRLGQFLEQGYANRFVIAGETGKWMALLANRGADEVSVAAGGESEIETIRRRLAELERLWFDTRKALAEGTDVSGKLAELESQVEADRIALTEGESYLEQARRHREKSANAPPAGGTVREPASRSDLQTRRLELERQLAKTGLPEKMPADLPGVLVQADEIRQEMIAIQKEAAELRQQLLQRPAPSWRPALLVTVLTALLIAVMAWMKPAWLMAALTVGGTATMAGWALYLWRLGRERQARNRLKQPLQVLESRREEAQARLTGLDDSFLQMGLSPSAVEIVRMQKNLERHLRLQQELAEVEKAMAAAGGGESATGHRMPSSAVALPEEISVPVATLSADELAAAEAELAAVAERLHIRQAELQELARQAAERDRLATSLRQIEAEGETLRRRESDLARRPAAPAAAAGEIRPETLTRLNAEIGPTLALLTADRYSAVRYEEASGWSLRGGDGEWHPLQHFSRGTTESFCLALRLHLGRQLAGDRRLPLILDDTLAGYDQARMGEACKLLERLAGEQQVILLAGDESLRKRASRERWHMISLVTETSQKPSRSQERNDDDGQLHLL